MNEFIFRSIIESWVNCEQCGISKEIKEPQKLITDDELRKQTEKKEYLAIFKDFMHKYIDAIRVERGYTRISGFTMPLLQCIKIMA